MSASVPIVLEVEFVTNISDRYSSVRLLVTLYIMVAVSLRIISDTVGYFSLLLDQLLKRDSCYLTILAVQLCDF